MQEARVADLACSQELNRNLIVDIFLVRRPKISISYSALFIHQLANVYLLPSVIGAWKQRHYRSVAMARSQREHTAAAAVDITQADNCWQGR